MARLDKDYRLGKVPLRDVLAMVQETVHRWEGTGGRENSLSSAAQGVLDALLAGDKRGIPLSRVPAEVWAGLQAARPDVYAGLRAVSERLPKEKRS